jgi:hypothetical protein
MLSLITASQDSSFVAYYRDNVCGNKIQESTSSSGVCMSNQTVFGSAEIVCNSIFSGGTIVFCQALDCKTKCTSVAFVNSQCLIVRGAVSIPAGQAPYFRATCIAPAAASKTPVVAVPLRSPNPSQPARENTPPQFIEGASPSPISSGATSISSSTIAISAVIAACMLFA